LEDDATSVVRFEPPKRRSPPEIVFPADGVELLASRDRPVALAARGGAGRYQWYVANAPIAAGADGRAQWTPAGPGFYEIVVVDGAGLKSKAKVRVSVAD
ncbi:MAG: hypothetical protein K2Q06_00595, partial [Parvularculaceae bacterium]|nr:hypothetical protein [Parvularculaceae bacterium]